MYQTTTIIPSAGEKIIVSKMDTGSISVTAPGNFTLLLKEQDALDLAHNILNVVEDCRECIDGDTHYYHNTGLGVTISSYSHLYTLPSGFALEHRMAKTEVPA